MIKLFRCHRTSRIFKQITHGIICSVWIALSSQHASAVTIAYLDSGADPALVAGQPRLSPGFDFVNDDSIAEDGSISLLGTVTARVLLGQTSSTTILPQKVTEPGFGWQLGTGDAAMKSVLEHADVRVVDINARQPVSTDLLRRAVGNGKIIVVQAGDSGHSSPTGLARSIPSLSGGGMIVGGVDKNNKMSISSNRAGDLRNHYLVAPAFSPHTSITGTVIAKSNTAAAAAVLLEASPNLSPRQAVEILLKTATDLGTPGVDSTFGHGLLNLKEALSPQGTTSVGGNDSGGSGGGAIIALALAGAVGYALFSRSDKLEKTLIMDQYDRPFTTNLIGRAPILGEQNTAALLGITDHSVQYASRQERSIFGDTITEVSAVENGQPLYISDDQPEQIVSIKQQFNSQRYTVTHLLNQSIAHSFGLNASASTSSSHGAQAVINSPYLGISARGVGMVLGLRDNPAQSKFGHHTLGLALGDEQTKHRAPTRSFIYQGRMAGEQGEIGLQLAFTRENGSLLGGAANGPFSVKTAQTLSTMIGGAYNIHPNWSVGGSYAFGRTQVEAQAGSLLTGFSTLYSAAGSLNLQGHALFSDNDSLQFSIRQPISFKRGTIGLDVPTSVNALNQPLFSHEDIQLDGLGAVETQYSLSYLRPLSKRSSIEARWLKRDNKITDQTQQGIALVYSHQL